MIYRWDKKKRLAPTCCTRYQHTQHTNNDTAAWQQQLYWPELSHTSQINRRGNLDLPVEGVVMWRYLLWYALALTSLCLFHRVPFILTSTNNTRSRFWQSVDCPSSVRHKKGNPSASYVQGKGAESKLATSIWYYWDFNNHSLLDLDVSKEKPILFLNTKTKGDAFSVLKGVILHYLAARHTS